ncbi:MAG: hypothetical protein ACJ8AD_12875 [Gemmatimonadaceae bacterium]
MRSDAASPALARYDEAARILTGTPVARAEDAVEWLRALVEELHVPRLGAYGVTEGDIARIV